MMHHRTLIPTLLLLGSAIQPLPAPAQNFGADGGTAPAPLVNLDPASLEFKNRIGISYRMGLNITVDFKKLGGLGLSDPGAATGGAVNRNYDNRYNRVDSSGNANNQTWYWGY